MAQAGETPVSRNHDSATDQISILSKQYELAHGLYVHEDELNWRKLNNLFYVTAGLMGAAGFILGLDNSPMSLRMALLGLISAAGLALSVGFRIALRTGVNYLQERKNSLIALEERLIQFGGLPLVSKNKPGMRISPTTKMLKVMPDIFFVIWISFLGTLLWFNLPEVLGGK